MRRFSSAVRGHSVPWHCRAVARAEFERIVQYPLEIRLKELPAKGIVGLHSI